MQNIEDSRREYASSLGGRVTLLPVYTETPYLKVKSIPADLPLCYCHMARIMSEMPSTGKFSRTAAIALMRMLGASRSEYGSSQEEVLE